MSKRRERREGKRRGGRTHELAGEAMRTAGELGSIVENGKPEDTSEMRGVLTMLLQTEETLANIARRYISRDE